MPFGASASKCRQCADFTCQSSSTGVRTLALSSVLDWRITDTLASVLMATPRSSRIAMTNRLRLAFYDARTATSDTDHDLACYQTARRRQPCLTLWTCNAFFSWLERRVVIVRRSQRHLFGIGASASCAARVPLRASASVGPPSFPVQPLAPLAVPHADGAGAVVHRLRCGQRSRRWWCQRLRTPACPAELAMFLGSLSLTA